jgi:hypothetical protein
LLARAVRTFERDARVYAPTVKQRATAAVLTGQLLLALFTLICVALHPGFVLKRNEGGFSNYGVHIVTFLPYSLAFISAGFGALFGSQYLHEGLPEVHTFRRLLVAYGILSFLVLASTYGYQLNHTLKQTHVIAGIAMMVFQFIVSAWISVKHHVFKWALAVQVIGLVIAALTLFVVVHLLFMSQVLCGVSFGILLVKFTRYCQSIAIPQTLTGQIP